MPPSVTLPCVPCGRIGGIVQSRPYSWTNMELVMYRNTTLALMLSLGW